MISKVIRVPEKLYIRTLIMGRNNSSLIVDELNSHAIPLPQENAMKRIYEEVITSNPAYFQDAAQLATDEWIEQMDVHPMFYYRFKKAADAPMSIQGCKGAFKILEDPKIVRIIHALRLNGVPSEDVELVINAKYNIAFDSPDFDVFIKFFANYDDWTYQDKELYIQTTADPDLKKLLKTALTSDRSQLVWELGLGTDPNASFDNMLREMTTDSFYLYKKNIKHNPDDATKFSQLFIKLMDRMEQNKEKEATSLDLFSELKLKLVTEDTKDKKKSNIVAKEDMDIEIPERTEKIIPDLSALMNSTESVSE